MTPLEIAGWTLVGLAVLAAIMLGVRHYVIKLAAETFELGRKLGRASALMSPEMADELIRSAGVDPEKLPGRGA